MGKKSIWLTLLLLPFVLLYAQKTGIGTNNPQARFHIYVPSGWNDSILAFSKDLDPLLVVTSTGKTGIGTWTPTHALTVWGNARIASLGVNPVSLVMANNLGMLFPIAPSGNPNDVLLGDLTWGPYPGTASDTVWIDSGSYIYPKHLNWINTVIMDTGWVGIGTNQPGAPLEVAGYIWQSGIGGAVIIGGHAGKNLNLALINQNTLLGDSAGASLTIGFYTTAIGKNSASGVQADDGNTAVGWHAMEKGSGAYNIAVGWNALGSGSDPAGKNNNIAIGFSALRNCAGCSNNIAIGWQALDSLQSGSRNVVIGSATASLLTSHNGSVAIGDYALSQERSTLLTSSQVAVGYLALSNDQSGSFNTAVGPQSLLSVQSTYSTAIGSDALGDRNGVSYGNTAIGALTMYGKDTFRYNTVVGERAMMQRKGDYNVLVGAEAGFSAGTNQPRLTRMVAVGNKAAYNMSIGGSRNIVIGHGANTTYGGDDSGLVVIAHDGLKIDSTGRSIFIGDSIPEKYQYVTPWDAIGIGFRAIRSGQMYGIGVGAYALEYNYECDQHKYAVAIGYRAMRYNTCDMQSIAIGYDALRGTTSTSQEFNVAIGVGAGQNLNSDLNIALGAYAMQNQQYATKSVAVGYRALMSGAVTTSYGPKKAVAIGADALKNDTLLDYNIAIGDSALATCNSCAENIGIGRWALASLASSTGNDQYNTAIGYSAMKNSTSGKYNIALGAYALNNSTGNENIAVGWRAMGLASQSGSYNIAFGSMALGGNSALGGGSGSYNIALGVKALMDNTTGDSNIAVGYAALTSNNSGSGNIAVGYKAMLNQKLGSNNIAIGAWTLANDTAGSNNIAVGVFAMGQAIPAQGSYNIALGPYALLKGAQYDHNIAIGDSAGAGTIIAGSHNIFIGHKSLGDVTWQSFTGSRNTLVGAETSLSDSNLNNATAIGWQAQAQASNAVYVGGTNINWIGGPVPWSTYSDERFKTNIREDVPGLEFVLRLRPVTYLKDIRTQYKTIYGRDIEMDRSYQQALAYFDSVRFSGFIAQEVYDAALQAGYRFSGVRAPDEVGGQRRFWTLAYADFVPTLTKSIQQQQKLIEENEKRIQQQEQLLSELERIDRQQEEILKQLEEKINGQNSGQ